MDEATAIPLFDLMAHTHRKGPASDGLSDYLARIHVAGRLAGVWQMATARTKLGPGGRIVIPAAQRKALGLKEGDELLLRIEDDELRIVSQDLALRRLQEAVARHTEPGELLSERLIAERRAEAERE